MHVVADLLAHFVDVGLLFHQIFFIFSESWVRCVQLCCEGQDCFCSLAVQLRWEAEEDGWRCTGVLVWLYSFQLFSCFLSPCFIFSFSSWLLVLLVYHDFISTTRRRGNLLLQAFSLAPETARGPNLWINPLFHIIHRGSAFLTELCMIHSYARDTFLLQHLCPGYSLCLEALLSDYIMTNSLTSFNYSLSVSPSRMYIFSTKSSLPSLTENVVWEIRK